MRDFLTDKDHRRMVFIKGSVHQNHIDAPFIFKSVTIKKIMGKRGVYYTRSRSKLLDQIG